jgi:hypothetical protein
MKRPTRRDVDFNKKLEVHLKAMYERRDVNSDWMFPNEVGDGPKTSFRKQLNRVRKAYLAGNSCFRKRRETLRVAARR